MADKKFFLWFSLKTDRKSIDDFRKKVRDSLSGVENATKKMRTFGTELSKYVSLPLLAIGGLALKTSGDFEEAMNTLQAASGASGDEFQALREKAKEMGLSTKYSATESADAMTEFVKAGLSVTDTLEAVEDATNLATAAKMDMAQVVTIAADTMAQFNLKASDMGDIADTLMTAANASTTEVDQLSEALKYAGIVAGASGISLQETSTILAALASSGIKGSMAGTSFANVINGFRAPSREAIKAFQELGLAPEMFADSAGNMKMSIKEAFTILKSHGITATQMNKIFEKEGGNAFSGIMKNLGRIDEYEEAIAKRQGYASAQAAKGMNGFNAMIVQVKNSLAAVFIALGDAGLLEWATKAGNAVRDLLRGVAKINPNFLQFASVIAITTVALISGTLALGAIGGAMALVNTIMAKNLIPNFWTLAKTMFASFAPFFLIVLKIVLVVGLVYLVVTDLWAWWEGRPSLFGKIIQGVEKAIPWIKSKFHELCSWLEDIFKRAFTSLWEGIKEIPLIKTFIRIHDLITSMDKPPAGATASGVPSGVTTPIGQMSTMRNPSNVANQTLNVNPIVEINVNGSVGGDPSVIGDKVGQAIASHVKSAADSLKPAYAQ